MELWNIIQNLHWIVVLESKHLNAEADRLITATDKAAVYSSLAEHVAVILGERAAEVGALEHLAVIKSRMKDDAEEALARYARSAYGPAFDVNVFAAVVESNLIAVRDTVTAARVSRNPQPVIDKLRASAAEISQGKTR